MKKILTFILVFSVCLLLSDIYLKYSGIVSPMDTTLDHKYTDRYFSKNKVSYTFKESFGILKTDNNNSISYFSKQSDDSNYHVNLLGNSMVVGSEVFPRHHFATKISDSLGINIQSFAIHGMDIFSTFARYIDLKNQGLLKGQKTFVILPASFFYDTQYDPFYRIPSFVEDKIEIIDKPTKINSKQKQRVYPYMQASSLLTLSSKVISILSRGKLFNILFDKFYFTLSKTENETQFNKKESLKKKEILMMLNIWKNENVSFVYLGSLLKNETTKVQTDFSNECLALLVESGINYFDFSETLPQPISKAKSLYYHPVTKDYGHFNKDGHQYFSNQLIPFIIR